MRVLYSRRMLRLCEMFSDKLYKQSLQLLPASMGCLELSGNGMELFSKGVTWAIRIYTSPLLLKFITRHGLNRSCGEIVWSLVPVIYRSSILIGNSCNVPF